jgi:integrase/recombinase XerD
MTHSNELISIPPPHPAPPADQLRLAAAAYLAQFTGSSRDYTESDLRCYLTWCATVPPESPTLGFTHLQFEALPTAARESANRYDFALVAMLGLLGLRIIEASGADIADLGEEHGHRVLRVRGKGTKVVLIPLPPAVGRAIDRAVAGRANGPILRNSHGRRMDRHANPRTTMRYDRARNNLDRHPNYIPAASMASGT